MKCKACNKPITSAQVGMAGISATPNCKCGKIRARERLKGCPKCGNYSNTSNIITIKKHRLWWTLSCGCGHKWRVTR